MVGTTILSVILGKIVIRIHSAEWYIEIDCFILSLLRSYPVMVPAVVVMNYPTLIVGCNHVLAIGGHQLLCSEYYSAHCRT